MRVLVCGSRTFSDRDILRGALYGLSDVGNYVAAVIHGDAAGADTLARDWAEDNDISVDAFPADWTTYGRSAGPIRNQQMLDEGRPDLVLAFVDKPLIDSKGTSHMVRIARRAGVKTVVVEAQP